MTLDCPYCDHAHDMGDYPDHLTDMRGNEIEFECAHCEKTFDVTVDWEPVFYARRRADDGASAPPQRLVGADRVSP